MFALLFLAQLAIRGRIQADPLVVYHTGADALPWPDIYTQGGGAETDAENNLLIPDL